MSDISAASSSTISYASAQASVQTGASQQLEAVMAVLLEGLEYAASSSGTSGGTLLAVA
ncbi:MAG: hypothetical protein J5J00_04390 [Deltaproteobacteria bacterium]|nr:hypothetical protein [Deltaproteobacteria bacterium]